jgi:hypothetical protein
MLCVWLVVYHTLMWDRILQHGGRGLLHILLWCLLRGSLCRGMGKITRVFQPFEISDLGAMVSVVTELATRLYLPRPPLTLSPFLNSFS